jgi:radical SAM superfamily enzyme YgiQ (UPF0313 family)
MNIAFIAISGVSPLDKDLRDMARPLPGIANRWDAIAALPSLALLTLAGMTDRARHPCRYYEVERPEQLPNLPDDFDLVAISTYTARVALAYETAEYFRARGAQTVIGGPHVSLMPEEAEPHCDAVVVGEGERVWSQVLEDAEAGRLKPRYGDLAACFDMEEAPLPAFDLLDLGRYNRLPVQTSRGCTHRCEFCASSILLAGRYKQKPVEKVLAEIDLIRELWRRPFIEFADDNSFVNRRYWKELLRELRDRRVRWFTQCDLSLARDDELLELMRDSGCVQVLIGFESPTAEDLDGLELRSNWKARNLKNAAEAIRHIQSYGISVLGCFVVGMDAQGPECFDAVAEYARRTELGDIQVTVLTPFPGTPLYDRLLKAGRLLAPTAWERCTLYDVNFEPTHMTPEQLQEGFNRLLTHVYSPEETAWRTTRFKTHLRERLRQSQAPV